MNAQPGSTRASGTSTAPSYRVTLGTYNQVGPWSDVRTLTWPELVALLTQHQIGPKEGSCIVPAIFSGDRRRKDQAQRIDIAFLDSDAGCSLQQASAAVSRNGWAAIVSSTHSYLTTRTRANLDHWNKFRTRISDGAKPPAAFLMSEKKYLPRVAEGARLVQETGEFAIFEHQPCPKFRVVIPLLRPWQREAYEDQRQANDSWTVRIEALAAALDLDHDQSCTDTSRLFYLPRRSADGPQAETAVLDGKPCDIFSLPAIAPGLFGAGSARQAASKGRQDEAEGCRFIDPKTSEIVDLAAWAREHGGTFQLANALRARHPGVFLGKVADGTKHHIRCVNESAHTNAGVDAATFVLNASDSANKGFVYHCRHAHCDGRDRLFFLRKMLEAGWLAPPDLKEPRFQVSATGPSDPENVELTEHGVAVVFAQRHKDDLRFCHTSGAWYLWTGTHWAKDETKLAFNWARQLVASLNAAAPLKARERTGRAAFAAAVEQFAKADEAFAVTAKIWDGDPYLLCTPAGVVNLRSGRLRRAERADYMTRITATAPAETSDCPRWHQFLREVTGDNQELIRFVQQWFGYTLTGDTREEALLFVYGPGGNGKGKLLNTIQGILGTYCRTAPMETFTACQHGDRHPTDLAMLSGARMVCASETEDGRAWAEVRIKQLTGNDIITARFMRRDFFEYRPQFKLTVIGNHKPALRNVDEALRRRFNLVPFEFKPDPVDPELENKLRGEWPGILRWLIEGCLDWQRHGLLRPNVVIEATAEYFAAQDHFGRWLGECAILHSTLSEKPSVLLQSFQRWCEANGEPASDNKQMRGMIERTPGLRYATVNGCQRVRGIGLKLTDGPYWQTRVEGGGG